MMRLLVQILHLYLWLQASDALAFTANKVWFEFRPDGRFRVHVNYTIPELKEFRESWVDFARRKEAEAFYWDLVRGADFYPHDPKRRVFQKTKTQPTPW